MDIDGKLYEKMSEILSSRIRAEYKSIKAFSEKIGLPYTSVHTILNRSLGGASINAVIKICNELGFTIEELMKMAQGSTLINDEEINTIAAHHEQDNEFTEEELEEIENFKKYVLSKKKNKEN